jgi:hypothetical protein
MEQKDLIPGLLYALDDTFTPRPVKCDISGRLIISGLNVEQPISQNTGLKKIERVILDFTQTAESIITASKEILTDARGLSIFVDFPTLPAGGTLTVIVQTKNILSSGFVTFTSFGALAAAGNYNLEINPCNFNRFRLLFTASATSGTYAFSASLTESF